MPQFTPAKAAAAKAKAKASVAKASAAKAGEPMLAPKAKPSDPSFSIFNKASPPGKAVPPGPPAGEYKDYTRISHDPNQSSSTWDYLSYSAQVGGPPSAPAAVSGGGRRPPPPPIPKADSAYASAKVPVISPAGGVWPCQAKSESSAVGGASRTQSA